MINAASCLRLAVNAEKNLNLIFVLTAVSTIAYILGDREAGERVLARLRKIDLVSDKISFWEKIINHIGNDPSLEFHEIRSTLVSFVEQVDSFCSKNPINWAQQIQLGYIKTTSLLVLMIHLIYTIVNVSRFVDITQIRQLLNKIQIISNSHDWKDDINFRVIIFSDSCIEVGVDDLSKDNFNLVKGYFNNLGRALKALDISMEQYEDYAYSSIIFVGLPTPDDTFIYNHYKNKLFAKSSFIKSARIGVDMPYSDLNVLNELASHSEAIIQPEDLGVMFDTLLRQTPIGVRAGED
ncbi:MAG: hypothetical protein NC344_06500 [Bacteroidales bacterium]|nr:hypothetical protein [Bacteroidales bacterium]MCM1147469.1 hypothetical protein [Bacteroidales bacterium]MCM1206138.1 hypothetical protein [Bacillota bacterium]MCM1510031.1 hypothetical protein [Clostridium sp.]